MFFSGARIYRYRERYEQSECETVKDDDYIRMQTLIAPELTPTHAHSTSLVARLYAFYLGRAHPKYFRSTDW